MAETRGRRLLIMVAAAAVASIALAAQTAAPVSSPQLVVVSPEEDSYVSGQTTLKATLEPADAASAVIFFVDGR